MQITNANFQGKQFFAPAMVWFHVNPFYFFWVLFFDAHTEVLNDSTTIIARQSSL